MTTPQYDQLLQSVATIVADYRQGEIAPITSDHVHRWVQQFDDNDRLIILNEIDRILRQYYMPRQKVEQLQRELLDTKELFGLQSAEVLKTSQFLNIQGGGRSQYEMLQMLEHLTTTHYGVSIFDRPNQIERYFYLDDVLFSGNRALNDIRAWLPQALPGTDLHLVFNVVHNQGVNYVAKKLVHVRRNRYPVQVTNGRPV